MFDDLKTLDVVRRFIGPARGRTCSASEEWKSPSGPVDEQAGSTRAINVTPGPTAPFGSPKSQRPTWEDSRKAHF
jgi:hypothetical protein